MCVFVVRRVVPSAALPGIYSLSSFPVSPAAAVGSLAVLAVVVGQASPEVHLSLREDPSLVAVSSTY